MDDDFFDLDDDGAKAVVAARPARGTLPPMDLGRLVRARSGGRMSDIRAAGKATPKDYLLLRLPQGAARAPLGHAIAFQALWRLWTAKRVTGDDDVGSTYAEIACEAKITPMAARTAVGSLLRNQMVRAVQTHVGYQGVRTRFAPTAFGSQAWALAEVLGPAAFVQVGRVSKVWRNRSNGEPNDLFQFAALVRGGSLQPLTS
jgi:hypothetical protein